MPTNNQQRLIAEGRKRVQDRRSSLATCLVACRDLLAISPSKNSAVIMRRELAARSTEGITQATQTELTEFLAKLDNIITVAHAPAPVVKKVKQVVESVEPPQAEPQVAAEQPEKKESSSDLYLQPAGDGTYKQMLEKLRATSPQDARALTLEEAIVRVNAIILQAIKYNFVKTVSSPPTLEELRKLDDYARAAQYIARKSLRYENQHRKEWDVMTPSTRDREAVRIVWWATHPWPDADGRNGMLPPEVSGQEPEPSKPIFSDSGLRNID
jgi:hypothetical protein